MDLYGYMTPEEYQAEYEALTYSMVMISLAYRIWKMYQMAEVEMSSDMIAEVEKFLGKKED